MESLIKVVSDLIRYTIVASKIAYNASDLIQETYKFLWNESTKANSNKTQIVVTADN